MTDIALRASAIVAGRAEASMYRGKTKLYRTHVVVRDPEYYVGRAIVLVFAAIGFVSVAAGVPW